MYNAIFCKNKISFEEEDEIKVSYLMFFSFLKKKLFKIQENFKLQNIQNLIFIIKIISRQNSI